MKPTVSMVMTPNQVAAMLKSMQAMDTESAKFLFEKSEFYHAQLYNGEQVAKSRQFDVLVKKLNKGFHKVKLEVRYKSCAYEIDPVLKQLNAKFCIKTKHYS